MLLCLCFAHWPRNAQSARAAGDSRRTGSFSPLARLGGMAEKIRDGQTGVLTQPGSATAMAEVMLRLVDQPEFLTQLQQGVQRWLSQRADPERGHAQLYRRLMNC